jgi:hypothetical protein
MSTFSKPFSAGSTSIRRRCANGAKRSSIPSVQSRPNGSNTLLDEDAAAGCLRDGTTRFGLQPHPRNEPHGRPAAHGSDQSIVRPEKAAGTHSRRPPKSTFLLIPERFYTAKTHTGHDKRTVRLSSQIIFVSWAVPLVASRSAGRVRLRMSTRHSSRMRDALPRIPCSPSG